MGLPSPTPGALATHPRPSCQPAPLGSMLWVPLMYSQALKFVITQAEPARRGPVPPARPPTAQEVCYRRAQQAQRESASWLQAAQRPAEKPSSIHISAPGEKRRVAHVPSPRLAAGESQGPGSGGCFSSSGKSPGQAPLPPVAVSLSRAHRPRRACLQNRENSFCDC